MQAAAKILHCYLNSGIGQDFGFTMIIFTKPKDCGTNMIADKRKYA